MINKSMGRVHKSIIFFTKTQKKIWIQFLAIFIILEFQPFLIISILMIFPTRGPTVLKN